VEILIFEYKTSEERERIIAANSENRLVAERNLLNGNFLEFEDLSQERYIKSLEDQLILMAYSANGGIL